ncbi:hypothetical protein [Arthrobacter sp. IK3]|uniref:hypothetical protein n=1 Tax=Arthrobacter sp. IK3 TaxID=3448169 RepID=UPI003EDF5DC0
MTDQQKTTSAASPAPDGWPASLPEPRLKLRISDDCAVTTDLSVEGAGTISIFTDNPSTGRCDYEQFVGEFEEVDEDTMEQVVTWGSARHLGMEAEIHAAMKAAADLISARAAKAASGEHPGPDPEELTAILTKAERALIAMQKEGLA